MKNLVNKKILFASVLVSIFFIAIFQGNMFINESSLRKEVPSSFIVEYPGDLKTRRSLQPGNMVDWD